MDTAWSTQVDLVNQINCFLEIQEIWLQIDPDSYSVQELFEKEIKLLNEKRKQDITKETGGKSGGNVDFTHRKTDGHGVVEDPGNDHGPGQGHLGKDLGKKITEEERAAREFLRTTFRDTWAKAYCNLLGSPDFLPKDEHHKEQKVPKTVQKYQKVQGDRFKINLIEKAKEFLKHSPEKQWAAVKRGMSFEGFPVHFSDPDSDAIRQYLMMMPRFMKYIDDKNDDIVFTISFLLKPLPGQVLSTWFYIGIQKPLEENPKVELEKPSESKADSETFKGPESEPASP